MFVHLTRQSFPKGKMKPTATHHVISVAAWRQPAAKDAILDRIQAMTRELEAIQAEMQTQLPGPAGNKKTMFFEDSTATQVLSQFKAELDQLRQIVWFYIEQAAQKRTREMDSEQARRLERVTGLLRVLSPQPSVAMPAGEQSGSFFERLNVVIDSYMREKKPVSAESRTASPARIKASS
jgi:hypothetical protein